MFPTGLPGVALATLRLSLVLAIFLTWSELLARYAWVTWSATALGLLLCIGLATSICAAICIIGAVALAMTSSGTAVACAMLAAGVAITVALLGPGAFSVDARLFGRKRMLFDTTQRERDA